MLRTHRLAVALLVIVVAWACTDSTNTILLTDDAEDRGRVDRDVVESISPGELPDLVVPGEALGFEMVEAGGEGTSVVECQPGEGCFMDNCASNLDCQSGWCVQHLGQGVCSKLCQEECPPGWSCQQVAGTDPDLVYVCVSHFANLCRPCATNADCVSTGGALDACLVYPGQGSFCGGPCGEDVVCPTGFGCQEVETVEGTLLQQCFADAGICGCSQTSIDLGLTTPCSVKNDFGLCEGVRVCTDSGLGDCDALVPIVETCNGLDDDCDGEADEPALVDGEYLELCDDGNECTKDFCAGVEGCQNENLDGSECKDEDPCTAGDHCQAGECVSTPVICNDDNACTDDSCEVGGKCAFAPNNADCDDLDPCTVADECGDGVCAGTPVNCECESDGDCALLEDGDKCNGVLYCDTGELPYSCAIVPDSVVDCPKPQGIDAVCLQATCDPVTGSCSFVPAFEGFACDDGDACTVGDACTLGVCAAGLPTNCADDNVCTDDSCDSDQGCVYVNNEGPCSDGDVCTTSDACGDGECIAGPPLVCDDSDVCNGLETCSSDVGCVAGQTLVCDDGDPCNGMEICHPELGCQPGLTPDCDDGKSCTDDSCGGDGQCLHEPNNGWCDDGNECTEGDHCNGGACVPSGSLDCDDGNLCTDDTCDLLKGCINQPNLAPCDDADACTAGDKCGEGTCQPGQAVECDDGNLCTDDSCDPDDGCQYDPNQSQCDDGNSCTENDGCQAGSCKSGSLVDCDDGKLCTTDTCDMETGCKNSSNSLLCDDSDACTAGDTCGDGECQPGQPLVCNDGNVCTDDSCDSDSGCEFVFNQAECSDNNVCTDGDECANGLCMPGSPVVCEDDNPCTQDYCHFGDGCQYPALPDGTPCSAQGICAGTCETGLCVEGAVEVCDGQDNTCDGEVDEGFVDTDDDGQADCVDDDDDGDGAADDADCEPLDPEVSPLADEICSNDVDDDCDPTTKDECVMDSCLAYLDAGLSSGDGIYAVDPDGDGPGGEVNVYCDMTSAGGGWTLCLNSVPGGKSPTTDIVSDQGSADWNTGHVRDCTGLGIDSEAEIRHLIIDADRGRIVNGYYVGKYHTTLPGENAWVALTGDAARPGESHTTFGDSCGFDYHFGRTWGCNGNCCGTYTYEWYYGGCWNYMPVQGGSYCPNGPSDGCNPAGPSCIERYSIFVRPVG